MFIQFTKDEFAQLISLITYFSSSAIYRADTDWTTIAYKAKAINKTYTPNEIKALNKAVGVFAYKFGPTNSDFVNMAKKIADSYFITH